MGAPSPELCNLWLARAFNAGDVEAATAMYHPDSSIVEVDQVHGSATVARGADGIRKTMAAYIDMKHGMEVHRKLPDGTWVFFIDHPSGADPEWAVKAPPPTK